MRKLKKVGEVLHYSNTSRPLLICRVVEYLDTDTEIYNAKVEQIGSVKETFGPVSHPFAKVEVEEQHKSYRNDIFIIKNKE